MSLYKNRFRTKSMRLSNWNYHWRASYFITICTRKRIHHFGEIRKGIMGLNKLGIFAYQEWLKSFEIRTDMNLGMGEFIVMPNHFHALIDIGDNPFNNRQANDQHDRDALQCVSTSTQNKFGPQKKNLASIIRGFKGSVTRRARLVDPNFAWQSGYHDKVICEPAVYPKIEKYIMNNPRKWSEDTYHSKM